MYNCDDVQWAYPVSFFGFSFWGISFCLVPTQLVCMSLSPHVVQGLHPLGGGCTLKIEAISSSEMVTTYQINIVISQKMAI
jgi:hypothetical protein